MYYKPAALNQISTYASVNPRLSKIGKIFILILLIVVFEGAIRKWVSSALTGPLILLRDGLALYGIFSTIKTKRLRFKRVGAQLLKLWTYFFLGWGLLQLLVNQSSPFIYVVGIRFWLLYLWFSYAAAVSLTEYDFNFIGKTILILMIAMTPLVVMQHFLPPGAFLNKQLDGVQDDIFLVVTGIVRTTGTFSFTLGFTTLLALATPFVLCLLTPGSKLWNRKWMPKFCILALGISTVVSGSRGAIIFFGLMFGAYIVATLLYSKRSKKLAALFLIVVVGALLALVPYLFSTSMKANIERFESASQSENLSDRVIAMFTGETGIYKASTLIGSGVGVGTNFAGAAATGQRTFLLAETEAARTILEGGLLGLAFIGLKLMVISVGLRKSWSILKSTSNTLPLFLWLATTIALLSWSIIGQLTVNALGYMLFGLAIASLRFNK